MGQEDLCHDCIDESQKEGCTEDERRIGFGAWNEGRYGDADAESGIQGTDGTGHVSTARIQNGLQYVFDRRLLP